MNKLEYQLIDNKCESALIDFHFHEDATSWIKENKNLFDLVVSNPVDQSVFANEYLDGFIFKHIFEFHATYSKAIC